MSRSKNELIWQEDEGWRSIEEKYVCRQCFTDRAFKEFIAENAINIKCDYCRRTSNQPIAASMDMVIELVARSLHYEWTDPAEELLYESREGGYQGETLNTYEVLIEVEFPAENELILDDIASGLIEEIWCRKNPFQLREDDQLFATWEEFCFAVKHQTRYLFFTRDEDPYSQYGPSQILEKIGMIMNEVSLLTKIKIGTSLFRAREHYKWETLTSAKDLGTLPISFAKYSNRMSPAGIPMFYGSFEEDTAIAEVVDKNNSPCKIVTLGVFIPLRDLTVLDLTNIPEVPSLFSDDERHLRAPISFLRQFAEDLSKPIDKDGYEQIEYVPTQIVTDYIRHRFTDGFGAEVDGIIYESSVVDDGKSLVLFISNDQCISSFEEGTSNKEKLLDLKEVKVVQHNKSKNFHSLFNCFKSRLAFLRQEKLSRKRK